MGGHPVSGAGFGAFGDFMNGSSGFAAPGIPTPGQIPAGLSPVQAHQREDAIEAGVKYRRVPIYPPFANLARDPNIVYLIRFRPLFFAGNGIALGVQPQQTVLFSQPTIVFARSMAAIAADDAALPVGRDGRDTCAIWTQRTSGDLIDGASQPILGSALYGTGGEPALFAGNGLFFRSGASMVVNCQTLINNIRVDFVLWTLEEYGTQAG